MAKKEKAAAPAASPPAPPPKNKTVKVGCPACQAHGHVDGDRDNPFCPTCQGSGSITMLMAASAVCPRCEGEGEHKDMPCRPCAATGRIAGDAEAGKRAAAQAEQAAAAAQAGEQKKYDEGYAKGRQDAFDEVAAAKARE